MSYWEDVTSQFSNTSYVCDLTLGNVNPIDWTVSYSGSEAPVAVRITATLTPDDGGSAAFSINGDAVSSLSNSLASLSISNTSLIDNLTPSDYPSSTIIYTGEVLDHLHFTLYAIESWMWSSLSTTFAITKIEFYVETPNLVWTSLIGTQEVTL